MPPDTPSTTMICSMPRPAIDMMVSSNSKRHPGVDEALRHQVQPPADEAGGAADQATTTVRTVAASPTVSDSRWIRG